MRKMTNKCLYKCVNVTFSEPCIMIYTCKDQLDAHFSLMI